MKSKLIVFPVIIGLMALSGIQASDPVELTDENIPDLSDFQSQVKAAIDLVSNEWGDPEPVFPPLDATSIIRSITDHKTTSSSPSRANPIPTSWDLVSENDHSRIYVEEGLSISSSDIDALAEIFDDSIYPNSTDWFHPSNPYDVIDIRIYDFGDGPGNTGGFFLGSYATRNDLFVDSADLDYSRSWSFEIVAHEFQHLLHFDLDSDESIWLNEGLADLSARISLGPGTEGIQSHIEAYEYYPENDLLTWDEGVPPDYIETIADYGRAYAFVSYLAYHYGGKEFIRDLAADSRNSVSSVNGELAEDGFSDRFDQVVAKEKVANLVDDPVFGGGVYHQGLIDIGIKSLRYQSNSYPASHTIIDTVRHSGYYLRFTSGSPSLAMSVDSLSSVHVSLIGLSGGTIVHSENITGDGSEELLISLPGFDEDYQVLYAIIHTPTAGAEIEISIDVSDLEPPVTDVQISPPDPNGDNGYYLDPPGISLTTSEGAYVMYAWGEGSFQEYTTTLHPPEGESFLRFYAQGPFGLREEERMMDFKVDTTDPVTSISISPETPDGENGYYVTDPVITISTENPADVSYYDYGGGPVEYDGSFTLGHGDWELDYWSIDLAGRTDEMETIEVKIDLAVPSIDLYIEPGEPEGESGFYIEQPLITLDVEEGATGWFTLNGDGPYQYTSPFNLEDGEWEIDYYSSTPSGRTSDKESEYVKVDTTPPLLSIEFDPPLCSGWCSDPTYLTLSTEESRADIIFHLGDEGPFTYTSPVLLVDGEYEVTVRALDPAGNIAEGGPFDIKIDNTVPVTEIEFDRPPDNDNWFYDTAPSIELTTTLPPVSPEVTYVSLDGEQFREFTGQELEMIPGRNTIHYYSEDLAGNRESIRRRDINIDTSTPLAVLSANRTLISKEGPVRFSIAESTDDIEVYRFRIDFGDGDVSDWIYGTEVTHDYERLGDFVAVATVEDAAGRTNTNEASVSIEVLTREEYEERLEGEGTSILIILGSILLLVIALAAVGILIFVLVKRRTRIPEDVEMTWERV